MAALSVDIQADGVQASSARAFEEGSRLTLTCRATAEARVTWTRDGEALPSHASQNGDSLMSVYI